MRWNPSEWLRITSHLAVLIGLVLIYAEIQNNTHVTRAVLIDSGFVQISGLYGDFVDEGMANVWTKAVNEPAELTLAERALLNERLERWLILYTRERYLTNLGIYEEWEGMIPISVGTFFSNPYGRAFWAVRRNTFNPEIASAVDRALAGTGGANVYSEFDSAILTQLEQGHSQE